MSEFTDPANRAHIARGFGTGSAQSPVRTIFETDTRDAAGTLRIAYHGRMIPEDQTQRHVSQSPENADFYNDPYRFYAQLHAVGGPVYWEDYGFWCLSEFDAVNSALKDSRFARLPPAGTAAPEHPAHLSDFAEVERHSLLALEHPEHTRIRRSVNQAFMNRHVMQMAGNIEQLANQLIDGFEDRSSVDLLSEYATRLPVTVIARLLGVPESACDSLLDWSHAMVRVYTLTQTKEEEHRANRASAEFRELLLSLIHQRRRTPADDLLSHLVHLKSDPLSDAEIVSTAVLLLNAGHEATVHQIGNAVKTLLALNWPTHWIDDIQAGDRIVAEAMRFDAPLHLFTRYAQEEVELHEGIVVHKGEQIALLLGAANRDQKRFALAHEFNPDRDDAASVAFGAGSHFCIGATLAKLEMRIAINTLFKRLPNLTLVGDASYQNNFHFHGLESLKVAWSC